MDPKHFPERSSVQAKWFVDGKNYMEAVGDALDTSREEIFIAGWWLSPEIYLKRIGVKNKDEWRLDKVLQRKSREGVKVYVLLYQDFPKTVGINSKYSKWKLNEMSSDILVIRHPNQITKGKFLWAHHEKLVIVDRELAFVGGIDLCFSRWDDETHRLVDLGGSGKKPLKKQDSNDSTIGWNFFPPLPSYVLGTNQFQDLFPDSSGMNSRGITPSGFGIDLPATFSGNKSSLPYPSQNDPALFITQQHVPSSDDKRMSYANEQLTMDSIGWFIPSDLPDPNSVTPLKPTVKIGGGWLVPFKPTGAKHAHFIYESDSDYENDDLGFGGLNMESNIPQPSSSYPTSPYFQPQPSIMFENEYSTPYPPISETNPNMPSPGFTCGNPSIQSFPYPSEFTRVPSFPSANDDTGMRNVPYPLTTEKNTFNPFNTSMDGRNAQQLGYPPSQSPYPSTSYGIYPQEQYSQDAFANTVQAHYPLMPNPSFSSSTSASITPNRTFSEDLDPPKIEKKVPKGAPKTQGAAAMILGGIGKAMKPAINVIGKTKIGEAIGAGLGIGTANEFSRSQSSIKLDEDTLKYIWIGKDYTNFYKADYCDLHMPMKDVVDREIVPRVPWHDISLLIKGSAVQDVASHFIERWNSAKADKCADDQRYPRIKENSPKISSGNLIGWSTSTSIMNGFSRVSAQVIRSISTWSGGQTTENSIQQSYIQLILSAEKYVYIENQFFITSASTEKTEVKNGIGKALYTRILRAYREQKPFRVFVVMPLLPGFEGELGTNVGNSIHRVQHWNYWSICRGENSLIACLKKAGVDDPTRYITFHGLRNWADLNGRYVTEIIYVHSKLMIVDDKYVICGSANINDRSMSGKRDSEVAILIKDEEFRTGYLGNEPYEIGIFASTLREQLFREHLGLLNNLTFDLGDITSDEFYYGIWQRTAQTNTQIYEQVFLCEPTDECKTFSELQRFRRKCLEQRKLLKTSNNSITEMLANIKGHLVTLPFAYLRDEDFIGTDFSVETLIPDYLWT